MQGTVQALVVVVVEHRELQAAQVPCEVGMLTLLRYRMNFMCDTVSSIICTEKEQTRKNKRSFGFMFRQAERGHNSTGKTMIMLKSITFVKLFPVKAN